MTPRTSVIMPVYGTADRVIGAIRSVQEQTDPDLELLVLIDASPDDAAERIRGHLAEHPDDRVRVVENPVNRGVSAVRNQGLDMARGEWICFLDSDDRYRPHFLATLHAFAAAHEADLAQGGHTLVRTTGEEQDRFPAREGIFTGTQAALALLRDRMSPFVWDKLIRREVIGSTRFVPGIHRGEDAVFCASVYAAARRVVVVPTSLYEYTVEPSSLSWGRLTPPEESLRLMRALADAAGPLLDTREGRRAYAAAWVLTFLNAAQQALPTASVDDDAAPDAASTPTPSGAAPAGPPNDVAPNNAATARRIIADARRRITWRQLGAAAAANPVHAAAGTLLKLSPALYRRLYGAYVRRAYGL